MSYPISIPLRADLFHAIREHAGEGYFGDKAQAAVNEAVSFWLAALSAPAAPSSATPSPLRDATGTAGTAHATADTTLPHRGYQWKRLFLPDGTLLRTAFRGRTRYAVVEGEHIVCDSQPLTPSAFANLHGCGQRNAWRAIWLRLPGAADWALAHDCRPGRA
ncbi:hypothetical protein [Massilia sp. NR 4-1]|uniref:hypothetical protein n=1 Tax=Massilia sp. NR 4-1 TaxID=1678028 RepID=UPI00067BEFF1|nr:hypothetical protein [Massilia sp. NR 4-1]AKU22556.1 hypothetical protein ACZ75_14810 [Massilia sp. NR 4-1]